MRRWCIYAGAAVAEPIDGDAPRAPRLPSLPSPPEIVRSLSEQLSSFTNNGDAPSLTGVPPHAPAPNRCKLFHVHRPCNACLCGTKQWATMAVLSPADSPDATPSSDVKPPGDDQATEDQPRVPEQGSELDRLMVTVHTPLPRACSPEALRMYRHEPLKQPQCHGETRSHQRTSARLSERSFVYPNQLAD